MILVGLCVCVECIMVGVCASVLEFWVGLCRLSYVHFMVSSVAVCNGLLRGSAYIFIWSNVIIEAKIKSCSLIMPKICIIFWKSWSIIEFIVQF